MAQFVSFGLGRRPAPAALLPARPPARPPLRQRRGGGRDPPRPGRRRLGQRQELPARPRAACSPTAWPADDVLATLRARAGEGLHTIANETVDVDDGGVSGVALGGLVEFAPGDTPRSVERPGTVALAHDDALALLGTVYGFTPDLDSRPGERVEFSIHPLVAGVRQTHTIVWEAERVDPVRLTHRLAWPNRFSRFIGDKAFGLLVADLHGLPVPATTVVGRRLAPFRFGRPTGTGERWLRTCPAEPAPGRFLTQRGWRDPFALLAAEDPSGRPSPPCSPRTASAPAGSGAASTPPAASWSRACPGPARTSCWPGPRRPRSRPGAPRRPRARRPGRRRPRPGPLRVGPRRRRRLGGPAPPATAAATGTTIHPGTPSRWRRFDPSLGLEHLRRLIATVAPDEGIEIAGDVGVTSHAGDLLRRASIPSRLAGSS